MKSLTISDITAKQLYPTASTEFKIILEETFTKEFFNQKLIDIVKTIDDVYKHLGRKKPTILDYKFLHEQKRERALNTQYIDDISELFNEGWIPDFTNHNQYKYYNCFEKKDSGWVFVGCSHLIYGSSLGFGFYFKSREISQYCGKQFLDIYSKIL